MAESITLSARWSLAKRELDLHPGDICSFLPDLADRAIAHGHAVRCIGVRGIGRDVAVRVVRL
jgi:hypothetical protein